MNQEFQDRFNKARLAARQAFRSEFPNPSDRNSQLAAVFAYKLCCEQVLANNDNCFVDERNWHTGSSRTSFCWVVALSFHLLILVEPRFHN